LADCYLFIVISRQMNKIPTLFIMRITLQTINHVGKIMV